jgi:hypothetical protein
MSKKTFEYSELKCEFIAYEDGTMTFKGYGCDFTVPLKFTKFNDANREKLQFLANAIDDYNYGSIQGHEVKEYDYSDRFYIKISKNTLSVNDKLISDKIDLFSLSIFITGLFKYIELDELQCIIYKELIAAKRIDELKSYIGNAEVDVSTNLITIKNYHEYAT